MDGKIVTHGWQTNTGIDLYDATNEFVKYGFTEFLTTNVSKDGTLEGPDIESLKKICKIESCNVIESGGISKIQDITDVNEVTSVFFENKDNTKVEKIRFIISR